jgi:hypothetical protein
MRPIAIATATALVLAALGAQPARAASTWHLSPSGSDAEACTEEQPCRTLERAQSVALAGDTIVLHSGTYGAAGERFSATKPGLTFTGAAGEDRPALVGRYATRATDIRWTELVFDGPTGNVGGNGCEGEDGPLWFTTAADGGRVDHSEIRNSRGHFGVYVEANAEIDHDWLHDNGCFGDPAGANLDHGIYWASGSGAIHDNLIEDSYAYGIQLYPGASGVSVRHNTIVGSGRGGIIVAGSSTGIVISNNIIADNSTTGITSFSLTGGGNDVRTNLIHGNPDGAFGTTTGLTITGPTVAQDPLFVSATDFRLQPSSPAIGAADPGDATATDLDDVPRDPGALADLGAYEFRADGLFKSARKHGRAGRCHRRARLRRCRPPGPGLRPRAARGGRSPAPPA